jgi:hypothetical protein
MKHLVLCRLREFMQKKSYNSAELSDTFVKAKMTKFFGFAMEIMERQGFVFKLLI